MCKSFQFSDYDVPELEECAEAFKHNFRNCAKSRNKWWTVEVCRWFVDHRCGQSTEAYCRGRGEYLVDLCHLVYPSAMPHHHERWKHALDSGTFAMKFAMECEWGSLDRDKNLALILDDAAKLALLRANVKVMIFASNFRRQETRSEIVESIKRLRTVTHDCHPWLCIDVPYKDDVPRHIWSQCITGP